MTLSGQLKRLHQIIVNGGLRDAVANAANATNTSTAMMVLLLSTALFLLPGFKDSRKQQQLFALLHTTVAFGKLALVLIATLG